MCSGSGGAERTYESLEEVALEDVDDPLDGVSELPVLGVLQLGPVLLQQQQGSLCIWTTGGSSRGSFWASTTNKTNLRRWSE